MFYQNGVSYVGSRTGPLTRKTERQKKKKADHSKSVGSSLNKQGNLIMMLVLGCHKMSRSPHLPTRILKVYIESLTVFRHMYNPGSFKNTLLSQGYVLGTASTVETVGRVYFKGQGREWGDSDCPHGSSGVHILLIATSNIILISPVTLVTKLNRNSHLLSWDIWSHKIEFVNISQEFTQKVQDLMASLIKKSKVGGVNIWAFI